MLFCCLALGLLLLASSSNSVHATEYGIDVQAETVIAGMFLFEFLLIRVA